MPYKSLAQMRYMHMKHPKIAKEWDDKYGKDYIKHLPEHKQGASRRKKALKKFAK